MSVLCLRCRWNEKVDITTWNVQQVTSRDDVFNLKSIQIRNFGIKCILLRLILTENQKMLITHSWPQIKLVKWKFKMTTSKTMKTNSWRLSLVSTTKIPETLSHRRVLLNLDLISLWIVDSELVVHEPWNYDWLVG